MNVIEISITFESQASNVPTNCPRQYLRRCGRWSEGIALSEFQFSDADMIVVPLFCFRFICYTLQTCSSIANVRCICSRTYFRTFNFQTKACVLLVCCFAVCFYLRCMFLLCTTISKKLCCGQTRFIKVTSGLVNLLINISPPCRECRNLKMDGPPLCGAGFLSVSAAYRRRNRVQWGLKGLRDSVGKGCLKKIVNFLDVQSGG